MSELSRDRARRDYIEGCTEHRKGTEEGDSRRTNRAYRKLAKALRTIRQEPDRGVEFLASLLSNSDLSVSAWAASHVLPDRTEEARAALARVAMCDARLISFDAEMTLREWDAGRLKVD